jgi:ubiquitin-protein ligase
LNTVLPYIESLLSAPDLSNPMNAEAAALFQNDRKAFEKRVAKQIRNHQ